MIYILFLVIHAFQVFSNSALLCKPNYCFLIDQFYIISSVFSLGSKYNVTANSHWVSCLLCINTPIVILSGEVLPKAEDILADVLGFYEMDEVD